MSGTEAGSGRQGGEQDAGIPPWLARRLLDRLGAEAGPRPADLGALLRADPWALLAVPEVRPDQADAYARSRLGPAARPDDPRRARAVVGWVLERAARDGSTCLPVRVVGSVLAGLEFPDPGTALAAALEDGGVLAFPADEDGGDGPGDELDDEPGEGPDGEFDEDGAGQLGPADLLVLERFAVAEEGLAEALLGLGAATATPPGADLALDDLLGTGAGVLVRPSWGSATGNGPVASPVAGPVAELGQRAEAAGLRPTVVTPRSYLDARSDAGLVVVDQAELLDVELAAALAEAVPDGTHLVLAGDPDQLPPLGAGAVLRDVLAAGVLPVSRPRVAPPNLLAEVAAAVRGGTLPAVSSPDKDVVVVPAAGAAEAAHRTVQLVTDSIPRALGIPAEHVQVVVPARRGLCGSTALNAALKQRLNPGPGEFGGFDVGDRVVATVSGRLRGLTAGDAGVVRGKSAGGLLLQAGGREVDVPRPGDVLEHGWAMPVHLAAGSAWPAVVVALPGEAAGLLSRELVYTALTRAGRHLSVVAAAGAALPAAVARVPVRRRRTRLSGLLRAGG